MPESCQSADHQLSAVVMQKSQVLHQLKNGRNAGTSAMHNSDAQSAHDLRLAAMLGSDEALTRELVRPLPALLPGMPA
jgi:hypothetical protein